MNQCFKFFSITLIIVLLFFRGIFQEKKVTVAVAANAQFALEEIKNNYEKQTGVKIEIIKGASGKLTAQIKEGAPYDVFLSADTSYPNHLYREGFALKVPAIYGYGTLVLWTLKGTELLNINSLVSEKVKKVAIANPKLAPYGETAMEVLNYYKIYDKCGQKLVYGESLSQVSQYVLSGTAEVGFTAKSLALSYEMDNKGKWIEIDKKSYTPIAQAAIITKSCKQRNEEESVKFYNYLYSEKSKDVFKKYGYVFK